MPLIIIFSLVFSIVLLWFLRQYMRHMCREKLFKSPLGASRIATLKKHVPLYSKLPQPLREKLHGHINIFLDEKRFIGLEGIEITDEIRVVIAGNACLLLQGNKRRFTGFSSILIYPNAYTAHEVQQDGLLTTKKLSKRAGESWVRGPIVLSWADVLGGSVNAEDGHNVVIHEFAHKLDEQSGHMNGLPVLANESKYIEWNKVLSKEYDALHQRAKRGQNKVLDAYGTVSPAEFFAVASESFFEKPAKMKRKLPELYKQLQTFYHIDPVSWG